jgi:hypothetical protein
MTPRYLLLFAGCARMVLAEEIPRAVQVAEPPAADAAAVPGVVMSRSGQFRVSGGDPGVRGSLAILAEEAKDELLRLTGEKDGWKVPVQIRLHGKQGDPLPPRTLGMHLAEVEGARELRLDVHLSRGIEHERFKRAVTIVLLYERPLAVGPARDPDAVLTVPPWLADGLREAVAWRLNQSDLRLYQALFRQGGLFRLDDLFGTGEAAYDEMDGAMRAAFRVSSGALVMALLEQPQGREAFKGFLSAVAAYEGEMPGLLARHFPDLNLSETSLAKWWTLQLANKGGINQLTDVLNVPRSEAALVDALRLHFRTPEGIVQQRELSAWPELAALSDAERLAAVRPAQDALVRLSYRCFPSYRPLLVEYQELLGLIARNKTRDVGARLDGLAETRKTMVDRATRARDYLDWFEITRARETSGVFDDYLRLKERLKTRTQRRDDELSAYLDRMERIFHRDAPNQEAAFPR